MKVTEFFVGFGPRLWSFRRGETEYGVKAFPLGGYVKIIGMNNLEEVDPADEPRSLPPEAVLAQALGRWSPARPCTSSSPSCCSSPCSSAVGAARATRRCTIGAIYAARRPGRARPSRPASRSATGSCRSTATPSRPSTTRPTYIEAKPGQTLDVTVERHGQAAAPDPDARSTCRKVQVAGRRRHRPGGRQADRLPRDRVVRPDGPGRRRSSRSARPAASSSTSSAKTFDALGGLVTAHGVSSYGHMLVNQKAADSPTATNRFVSPVGIVRIAHQAAQNGFGDGAVPAGR